MQDISQRERLALMFPRLFPLLPYGVGRLVDDGLPFELTDAQKNLLAQMKAIVVEEKERQLSKEGITRTMKKFDDESAVYESPFGLTPDKRVAPCGRNDVCPCGSGRKYKRCCIKVKGPIINGGLNHAGR